MPKITSEIWKHFSKVNEKQIECKHCGKKLTFCGNTTNSWNHLIIHNIRKPIKPGQARTSDDENSSGNAGKETIVGGLTTPSQARVNRKRSSSDNSTYNKTKQRTLENTYDRVKSFEDGGFRQIALNDALLFMICKDHLPLQTPEKKGFQHFAKVAVPLWKPPSRATITRMSEAKYHELKEIVIKRISELPSLSLTFDVWTETHTNTSYLGSTLHFLNKDEMESCTLSVTLLDKSHTSDYLSETFKNICTDWNIDLAKVILVVTDNASNISKAAKETFKSAITCFDHTLNLVPHYAIGTDAKKDAYVPGVPELISKVKQIVAFVKHSIPASDELKKKQIEMGKTEGTLLHLVQEVPTRWSSCYFMITRFLELSDVLGTVLLKFPKVTMLTGAELATLRAIAKVLHPLQLATTEMSAETTTTVSKVIPIVYLLKEKIKNIQTESDVLATSMQQFVLKELDRRFDGAEYIKPLAVASILDPRFKKSYFQSSLAASQAITFISNEIKKNIKAARETASDEDEAEVPMDSLWALHDQRIKNQGKTHSQDFSLFSVGLPMELTQYLSRPELPRQTNVFTAWELMKEDFPNVYKEATKFLPLTATSVPSERLFSEAKLVISDLRSRLTSTHVSQLLFLASVNETLWST